jgi:hypothetical protein
MRNEQLNELFAGRQAELKLSIPVVFAAITLAEEEITRAAMASDGLSYGIAGDRLRQIQRQKMQSGSRIMHRCGRIPSDYQDVIATVEKLLRTNPADALTAADNDR